MEEVRTVQGLSASPPKESSSSSNKIQSLTKESLFWLDLENESKEASGTEYNSTTTTESSIADISSSSSSIASYDSGSEDHRHAVSSFYKARNSSNSSIGTLVLKLPSSSSTVNLQTRTTPPVHSLSDDENRDVADLESLTRLSTPERTPRKIKSSLKLPGLTRSRSMPNAAAAAGTSKTVRFSNDLTRVKTFNEHATPSAISLDNSPDFSPPDLNDNNYNSSKKPVFDLQNYFSSSSSSSEEDNEEEDYFNHRIKFQNSRWNLRYLNFNLFDNKFKAQKPVKLTSLSIVNNYSLVGTVDVANYAFEKYVEVKFTTDDWKSIYIITAAYERSLSSSRDQFRFEINLSKSLLLSAKPKPTSPSSNEKFINVGLCIKYVSDNCDQFYDNNNSQNYQLELISKPRERIRHHKRYSSEHLNRSLNALGGINNRLNFGIDNFQVNALPSEVPQSKSAPVKSDSNPTSTRIFLDETDYFNSNSTKNPNFRRWLESSSINIDNFQNYSSNTPSSSVTPDYNLSGSNSPPNKKVEKAPQSYDEFLKRYCFFKTPNAHESHETVFIS